MVYNIFFDYLICCFIILSICACIIVSIFVLYGKVDCKVENDNYKLRFTKKLAKCSFSLLIGSSIILFCVFFPSMIDNKLLLEEKKPSYWDLLGSKNIALKKSYNDTKSLSDTYTLISTSKDGFGNITCDDLNIYMNRVINQYPDASFSVICFEDGSYIEIFSNDLSEAVYVRSDGNYRKNIDVNISLQAQIDGITTVLYKYDNHKNPIYELHLDSEGNKTADINGVAEYFRKYDDKNHCIWEKRIGPDGTPKRNSSGTAEYRREYKGDELTRESYYDGYGNLICLSDKLYASVVYEYDNSGCLISEYYLNNYGKEISNDLGIARIVREYDEKRLICEYYIDGDGMLIDSPQKGYAKKINLYSEDGILNLSYFYNSEGKVLKLGSGNFHDFLNGINAKHTSIIISVRDEGFRGLTPLLAEDLKSFGLTADLINNPWCSYCAVVQSSGVTEELSKKEISITGIVDGLSYNIISACYGAGDKSSIMLDGREWSLNMRGMNIVLVEDGKVVESVSFDTDDDSIAETKMDFNS